MLGRSAYTTPTSTNLKQPFPAAARWKVAAERLVCRCPGIHSARYTGTQKRLRGALE